MSSRSSEVRRLRRAVERHRHVKIVRRSRPDDRIEGFVVDVGSKWVLVARTMDGGFADGHVAIRLRDIRTVAHVASFEEEFARMQPEWPPGPPDVAGPVDLTSTRGVLASLAAGSPLIGVERDRKYDALWIGVPFEITKKWLWLWEVNPRARWHDFPQGYRLRSITTVSIGGHYMRALAAMAGDPPAESGHGRVPPVVEASSPTDAGSPD